MPLTFNQKPQGPRQHIQSINDVLEFGKHSGVTVEDILHDEPGYFDWLFEKNIITATEEMREIINNAILNHMDEKARNDWCDWGDVPY
jgi:hypothetical protein